MYMYVYIYIYIYIYTYTCLAVRQAFGPRPDGRAAPGGQELCICICKY